MNISRSSALLRRPFCKSKSTLRKRGKHAKELWYIICHHTLRTCPNLAELFFKKMAVFCVVSSLQNHCLRAVACQLPNHETSLYALPVEIKAKLIHLLSKRGLLTDSNIEKVRLKSWYFTKLKPAQFVEALRPKSIILSFVKLTA